MSAPPSDAASPRSAAASPVRAASVSLRGRDDDDVSTPLTSTTSSPSPSQRSLSSASVSASSSPSASPISGTASVGTLPREMPPPFSLGIFGRSTALVTCACASTKFVAVGLQDGSVELYDVFGNLLDTHLNRHGNAVSRISLCTSVDVLASSGCAGNDILVSNIFTSSGQICLSPTAETSSDTIRTHARSRVISLIVDPLYDTPRAGRRIAWAESNGRVATYTPSWLLSGETELCAEGEPPSVLAWASHVLAVATTPKVTLFDMRTLRPVCVITAPPMATPVRTNKSSSSTQQQHTQYTVPVVPRVSAFLHEQGQDLLLHIAWPLAARVVRIGPHRTDPQFSRAPRSITVDARIERAQLPAASVSTSMVIAPGVGIGNNTNAVTSSSVTDIGSSEENMASPRAIADLVPSPMISAAPFGDCALAALVATPYHSLELHLVKYNAQQQLSVDCVPLPSTAVAAAEIIVVPGGDPFVLVLAHPMQGANGSDRRGGMAGGNVLYASGLTVAERVKWLLAHNRFADALSAAQSAPGGSLRRAEVSVASIGDQFLESIRVQGDYTRLAEVLPNTIASTSPDMGLRGRDKVMQSRRDRWEHWIGVFRDAGKLAVIAPLIPTYEPTFEREVYDRVLMQLAEQDPVSMLDVLKTWPTDVFGLSTVTRRVESQLAVRREADMRNDEEEREALRESLLVLYSLSGRHDETLNLLLKDCSPRVFEYIKSHHLYEAVRSRSTIMGLFAIDVDATTELLIHAPETVLPPDAVVPILDDIANSNWTFMYLHTLCKQEIERAPAFHNRLVKLYVKHGSPGMLHSFLKASTHYSLDVALDAMGGAAGTGKGILANERVHVLAAMGDTNSALDILLRELEDTQGAIEFASDHGDNVLWERLIKHAGSNADTLAALLDSPASGKVDPVRLIPLLNSEMRIPFLRDRLHRILVDAALERALREDATASLRYDAENLLGELEELITVPPG